MPTKKPEWWTEDSRNVDAAANMARADPTHAASIRQLQM
jgi:hypothetical protein